MSDPVNLALVALALPLAAAAAAALLGLDEGAAKRAHVPVIAAFALASALAVYVLVLVAGVEGERVAFTIAHGDAVTWFEAGSFMAPVTITVDPLSAVMLATVTFVATWIAVFSAGYMRGEEGYARYFALIALFVFAMSLLVLANNVMLLVAGWEGVGVCSYLLVGYYYAKPSAAAAARKAFLVTRLGDVGLILGIFYLWQIGGFNTNLDELFTYIGGHPETHPKLTLACLLLFCGAVGKSAQLPLYVWLPDAMEGPTPVSALIHAATMVTAGVYLLARCAPLFVLAPDAQLVVCLIGGLTAFVSAFIALTQTDLKRILAYSTVSQLGFMFMALGTGGAVAPSLAVTAAIFHLFTHAFFKALLFLASGSVMHAMGGVIDVRRFGGLRRVLPVTHLTFLAGAAALAGVPLLSGFWSKDAILESLLEAAGSESHSPYRYAYWFVFGVALWTALLTAFYTFRAYFLTFHGETRLPPEAGDHAHESPPSMLVPLVVLAVGALFAGIVVEPFTHWFGDFLSKTPSLLLANSATVVPAGHPILPRVNPVLAGISGLVALAGIALAWREYGKGWPADNPLASGWLYTLSRDKLYVDEVYAALVVRPAEGLATAGRQIDWLVAGVARLVASGPRFAGALLRPLQNGLVQFYALGMVLGLAVFLTVIVFRSTR